MKRKWVASSVGLVIAGLMAAGPSWAGDWSIQAVISNELNAAENRGLSAEGHDLSLRYISTANVDFDYAMPDGSFNLSTDLTSTIAYDENGSGLERDYLPHVGVAWLKTGKRDTLALTADYRFENLSLTDTKGTIFLLDDIPVDTIRETLSAGLVWTHKVNARNTLVFDNLISTQQFDQSVGTDNTTVTSTLTWERQLSRRTTGSLSAGVDWLQLDDGANTDRFIESLDAEFTHKLTKRLDVTAGAGIDVSRTVSDFDSGNTTVSGSFNLDASYRYKTGKIGLTVDYGLTPTQLGDFATALTAAVSVDKTINERSSINALAQLALTEGADGKGLGSDYTFVFSPTYNLALTDEWDLKAGYRFTQRNALTTANSNLVFVTLTRGFTVLP
jgi:hypothetical protein